MNALRNAVSIRIVAATSLLLLASLPVAGTALAAQRYLSIAETEPEPVDEVEVTNEVGPPLAVEGTVQIDDSRPVGVIERPGNASFLLYDGHAEVGGSYVTTLHYRTVPADSHMRGITVVIDATNNPDGCSVAVSYPDDATQRPPLQAETRIVRYVAAGTQTAYLPLPDLFVSEGTQLTFSYLNRGPSNSLCATTVQLHMRPIPTGVSGSGSFGFGS